MDTQRLALWRTSRSSRDPRAAYAAIPVAENGACHPLMWGNGGPTCLDMTAWRPSSFTDVTREDDRLCHLFDASRSEGRPFLTDTRRRGNMAEDGMGDQLGLWDAPRSAPHGRRPGASGGEARADSDSPWRRDDGPP